VLIEDSFTVRTPVDRLWAFIQDVERIAPCMPGAELTDVVDDRTWKGKVHVKFGPVQMAFSGTVVMEERDDIAHRAKLSAKGTEQRGKGVANAKVESWLEPAGADGTTVYIHSDITITGAAAQLSRGLLPEVSKLLTRQFAECLESKLNEESASSDPSADVPTGETSSMATTGAPVATSGAPVPKAAPPPRAVGGFGLGLRALWATVVRFFSRLFGRRTRT
jgi:carbon monoxide dehydrogenase subunit G